MTNYSQGSLWRRWDLHVHTKGTNKYDNFTSDDFESFCITFFREALKNEIAVIGVTDYFTIDNYLKVCEFVENIDEISCFSAIEKQEIKSITLIPNVELRIFPTTGDGRMINIHCLFNPDFVPKIENCFFNKLKHNDGNGGEFLMNRSEFIRLGKSRNSDLDNDGAYREGLRVFSISHVDLIKLKESDREFRENVIIAVTNKSTDGASGLQSHFDLLEGKEISSLDSTRSAIYRLSDCIFSSNKSDVDYFTGKRCDDEDTVVKKCGSLKPCIHGSDAHSEDHLFSPDQNRYCWIKADTTFHGLRQVIYEPFSGERVWIGPIKPDQKASYKIIKKITFHDSEDFPDEILFNPNLCSIIGSRSSGKSALLAYIADSIDRNQARNKKEKGPGEGYPWENVSFGYSITWANNSSNDESEGKVVYIPQNFLYGMSEKPSVITEKILPVLTSKLPQIGRSYSIVDRDIKDINNEIEDLIDEWFDRKFDQNEINETLADLGALKSVESEKTEKEEEIKVIKKEKQLNEEDLDRIQELSLAISIADTRISNINSELNYFGEDAEKGDYFQRADVSLIPNIGELPNSLQQRLKVYLSEAEQTVVSESNKLIGKYIEEIRKELSKVEDERKEFSDELDDLQKRQEKNDKLESLINRVIELSSTIDDIHVQKEKLCLVNQRLKEILTQINKLLSRREEIVNNFVIELQETDQTSLALEMIFGAEANIDGDDIENFVQHINVHNKSDFIVSGKPDIHEMRSKSQEFLEAIYSEDQKIKSGSSKLVACKIALTLTERIRFTAEMEDDKIGGFKDSTMTPGKRALFALRLLLAESEDTWPLLIDQPEDDLDSRSIYDDIVPFLREKKKERQIIMVSHNANLVVGADSEQVIVANRNGDDRPNEDNKEFNYFSGGLENKKVFESSCLDTLKSQGIREHTCQILEGGEPAFEKRRRRYDLNQK